MSSLRTRRRRGRIAVAAAVFSDAAGSGEHRRDADAAVPAFAPTGGSEACADRGTDGSLPAVGFRIGGSGATAGGRP